MIQIGETTLPLGDPWVIAGFIAAALFACLFLMIFLAIRAAGRSARAAEPLAAQIGVLGQTVGNLDRGQVELSGRMQAVTETQVMTQARMLQTMETRLEEVQRAMGDALHGTSTRTARSLGDLQQRGLLTSRAGAGIFVADVLGSAFSEALIQLFSDHCGHGDPWVGITTQSQSDLNMSAAFSETGDRIETRFLTAQGID